MTQGSPADGKSLLGRDRGPSALSAARRALPRLGLLALGLGSGLLLAEVGLVAAGFEHRTFPTVQFGWPAPERMAELFAADRDLFWVPRDYGERLSRAVSDRPAVAFLGDSCTQFGTYPERTLARVGRMNPRLSTGVNLGVGGWSAVQGLAQLKRDLLPLGPLVATFYFGWNGHWTALGPPDGEARPGALAWYLSQHSRAFQLLLKAHLAATLPPRAERPNRVDLATYGATLREMARVSERAGIRPVFITAPSNHRVGREPRYLADRHLRRLGDLVPLHLAYAEATRVAARTSGAALCDAAKAFDRAGELRGRYFKRDGIHLSEEGSAVMAELLAGCIFESMGPRPAAPASGQPKSAR